MNFSQETIGSTSELLLTNDTSNLVLQITNVYLSTIVINVILGSPVHCFVLWFICKGKGSGIVPEFFILNLTVCELLWCLCSFSFIAAFTFPKLSNMTYFMSALPSIGRPLFHCLICFERYLAVLHPVSFLKFKPLRYRLACSAVVWVIIPSFGVFCMFVLPKGNMYLFLRMSMPMNLLLFSFKLFCLLAILKALKFPKAGQRVNVNRKVEARQKQRKAMAQILIITVSMLGQYVPVLVIGSLYEKLSDGDFKILWCFTYVLSSIMTFVNPVLYICRVKKLPWLPDFL